MDTPDKAASLADTQVADAVNKDWLLASARSSQLSTDLKREQLSRSFESSSYHHQPTLPNNFYGSLLANTLPDDGATPSSTGYTTIRGSATPPQQAPSETSWLVARNLFWPRRAPKTTNKSKLLSNSGQNKMAFGACSTTSYDQAKNDNCYLNSNSCSINGHLYDNISYAELAVPLCSSSTSYKHNSNNNNDNDTNERECSKRPGPGDFCFGKFRILLTCYVLLGITLANYSRNAISLASVGMVASNVMNRELVDILANDPEVQLNAEITNRIQSALDGSCPVYGHSGPSSGTAIKLAAANDSTDHQSVQYLTMPAFDQLGASIGSVRPAAVASSTQELELKSAKRKSELEVKFRASIGKRVELGELVDWSPSELGLISAAGSVGNLLIAIPITRMGEIYGPKWIIFTAALGATIQAALMPVVATCNVLIVMAFQVIFNGLSYGADCVAYTLFAHWLPPTEMAFFVSCLIICYQLGTMMSSFATARILSQGISWSWCFYTPAILCACWTFVWSLIGASEPVHSKLISRRELLYLLESSKISQTLKGHGQTSGGCVGVKNTNSALPRATTTATTALGSHPVSWSKLASDPNIWAIIVIKFTLRWFFSTQVSLMPTYLSSVVHMSVDTIGTMSVGQSFIGLVLGVLMGYLTKSLVTRRPFNWPLATTRKCSQSIVNFGIALSLLAFITYDCNQWVTIVSLTIGGFCMCFYVAGALQIPLDLSPTHCGLITSITNTLALGQALGAPISGLILNGGPKDRTRWRIVWGMAIIMNTLSGLIFILLVDSKPRDYTKCPKDDDYEQDHVNAHTSIRRRS